MERVAAACSSAAVDLVAEGRFVTFDALLHTTCQKLGVQSLATLQLSPLQVPLLQLSFTVTQALDHFVLAFAASRAVASLRDLELEAADMLHTMQIPSFPAAGVAYSLCNRAPIQPQDPAEIKLSDDDDDDDRLQDGLPESMHVNGEVSPNRDPTAAQQSHSFATFGLGEIIWHPLVVRIWRPPPHLTSAASVGFDSVSSHVIDFLCAPERMIMVATKAEGSAAVDIAGLRAYLCRKLGVKMLEDVGLVLVERALPSLLKAFRQVQHSAYKHELKAREVALQQLSQLEEESIAAARKTDRVQQGTCGTGMAEGGLSPQPNLLGAVELRLSAVESVRGLVDSCRAALPSGWSPSFSKVRDVLKGLRQKKGPSSKKAANVAAGAFLDTCAEYVMLHLGSRKWRSRRWRTATKGEDDSAPETTSSDSSSSTSSSSEDCDTADTVDVQSKAQSQQDPPAVVAVPSKRRKLDHTRISAAAPAPVPAIQHAATCSEVAASVPASSTPTTVTLAPPQRVVQVVEQTWHKPSSDRHTDVRPTMAGDQLGACVPWSGHLTVPAFLTIDDTRSVGRWGEALVYQYLLTTLDNVTIDWVNMVEETRAPYDIVVTDRSGAWSRTRYIEVKTTRHRSRNVFELSPAEWSFAAKEPRINYDLYRVFGAGQPEGPKIVVVHNLAEAVIEGKARLCAAI